MSKHNNLKQPVIKWVGGKLWCYETLEKYFPPDIKNIYDPFVGGGGMLPAYANSGYAGGIYASDLMSHLINLWGYIQTSPEALADGYAQRWRRQKREGASVYYEYRDIFNQSHSPIDFLFLIRLSVNGMVRFNNSGKFNSSFHITRDGIEPDRFNSILSRWCALVEHTQFQCHDYRIALGAATAGDFVFLDPPYSASGSMYTPQRFKPDELWLTLEDLNLRGINWMLTYDGTAGIKRTGVVVPDHLYRYSFPFGEGRSAYRALNTKAGKKYSDTREATNWAYTNYTPVLIQPAVDDQLILL